MNEEVKNDNVVTEETTLVNNEESKVVEEEKNETPEVEVVPTEQEKKTETLFSKILAWTKRILSWLGTGILAILLIIVGWLTIDKYIVGNPVPSFMGYSFLSVSTGSMSGSIEEGDVIIIKDTGEYKIGDIVTFLPEGYDRQTIPTTHRIIGINDDGTFKTKGDANNTKDPVDVKKELIVGEVKIDENGQPLSVIRNVGVFVEWVKSGGGLIYIIAFIVILGGGIYLVVKKED